MKSKIILSSVLAFFLAVTLFSIVSAWNSSLDDDLSAYYNMNNTAENVFGNLNLTFVLSSFPQFISSGCLIGRCVNSTTSAHLDTLFDRTFNLRDYPKTMNIWVNPNSYGGEGGRYIISTKDENGSSRTQIDIMDTSVGYIGKFEVSGLTTGEVRSPNEYFFQLNEWTMLTLVNDGDNVLVYRNGVLNATFTANFLYPAEVRMEIGRTFEGMFDEMSFWNEVLSPSEIQTLYNGGAGMTFVPSAPSTSPDLDVIFPDNVSTSSSSNVTFIFNITGTALTNFTLVVSNSSSIFYQNTTFFNLTTSEYITMIVTGLPDNNYQWYAYAGNSAGQTSTSENRILTVNTTVIIPPVVSGVTSSSIYQVLQGSGSGIAIFLQFIAPALALILILIAVFGMIYFVVSMIGKVVRTSLNKTVGVR